VVERRLGDREHGSGGISARKGVADSFSGAVVDGTQQLLLRIVGWHRAVIVHEHSAIRGVGSGQDAGC
jgi:hypothetical protein